MMQTAKVFVILSHVDFNHHATYDNWHSNGRHGHDGLDF